MCHTVHPFVQPAPPAKCSSRPVCAGVLCSQPVAPMCCVHGQCALMCCVPEDDSNTSLEDRGDCKFGACSVFRETEETEAKLLWCSGLWTRTSLLQGIFLNFFKNCGETNILESDLSIQYSCISPSDGHVGKAQLSDWNVETFFLMVPWSQVRINVSRRVTFKPRKNSLHWDCVDGKF